MRTALQRSSRHRGAPDGNVVAALDIGTHKVCCLIASHEPDYNGVSGQRMRTLGFGHQRSQGIEAGAVTDLALAQAAVSAAVAQAEQAAGLRIDQFVVGVNCGGPRSIVFDGQVELPGGIVTEVDIARLDGGARSFAARAGRRPLSLNRIAFGLDGTANVREPRGLAGSVLRANHHAVTVDTGPLRNIELLLEACNLGAAAILPGAWASALAATTEEERQLGVVVIDIGAGLCSIAGFADGHFVHCDSLPLGGQHITRDLAHAMSIPLAQAERIKTLYGSIHVGTSDAHELVTLEHDRRGEDDRIEITRADVARLVWRRIEWFLAEVRARLEACGIERIRRADMVLTGGVSQTMGLDGVVGMQLGRRSRVSAPPPMGGVAGKLTGSVPNPAFSSVVGLAMSAGLPSAWLHGSPDAVSPPPGYLGRVERWLRESF